MAITREQYVHQSVQNYVRDRLRAKGYPDSTYEWLDSFDDNMFDGDVDTNYVASGYDFDNEGEQAELGSDLTRRLYTFEFYVIGLTSVWAQNLANAIKHAAEYDRAIPLLDIANGDVQIDTLPLVGVTSNRVIAVDPQPWQKRVWVTRVRVEDTYFATLV